MCEVDGLPDEEVDNDDGDDVEVLEIPPKFVPCVSVSDTEDEPPPTCLTTDEAIDKCLAALFTTANQKPSVKPKNTPRKAMKTPMYMKTTPPKVCNVAEKIAPPTLNKEAVDDNEMNTLLENATPAPTTAQYREIFQKRKTKTQGTAKPHKKTAMPMKKPAKSIAKPTKPLPDDESIVHRRSTDKDVCLISCFRQGSNTLFFLMKIQI